MPDTVVRSRIDAQTKARADRIFRDLGLTMSDAIRLFLRQAVAQQGLPFPVRLPNAASRAALAELDGLERLPAYPSTEAMWADLEKDDAE